MKYIRLVLLILFVLSIYASCTQSAPKDKIIHLVRKWEKKQIVYPSKTIFTIYGEDTLVDYVKSGMKYSIVSYIDSLGCLSCKLQAKAWKSFIKMVDSVSNSVVPVNIFIHHKKDEELLSILKREDFDIPICLDLNDSLRIINGLLDDVAFRTFLLDNNNRIVAIGNPIFNSKVKELYLNIIQGKTSTKEKRNIHTEIEVRKQIIFLGCFDWKKEQKAIFTLCNVGEIPLVINDVTASCGCTSVDYSKQPVRPGDSISLQVTYKADHPEHFDKTITVYCNTEPSLIQLKITGDAE